MGRGDREGGNGQGETGMVKWGGVEVQARAGSEEGDTWRDRQEGGNAEGEGAMGKGEGGNGKGEMRRGQRGGREEGARGEGISQMDMMKCLGGMR